jgi:hypothetical protein
MGSDLGRRIRWGNVARAAGLAGVIVLVVAWPRLRAAPPRVASGEAVPVETAPAPVVTPARPRPRIRVAPPPRPVPARRDRGGRAHRVGRSEAHRGSGTRAGGGTRAARVGRTGAPNAGAGWSATSEPVGTGAPDAAGGRGGTGTAGTRPAPPTTDPATLEFGPEG